MLSIGKKPFFLPPATAAAGASDSDGETWRSLPLSEIFGREGGGAADAAGKSEWLRFRLRVEVVEEGEDAVDGRRAWALTPSQRRARSGERTEACYLSESLPVGRRLSRGGSFRHPPNSVEHERTLHLNLPAKTSTGWAKLRSTCESRVARGHRFTPKKFEGRVCPGQRGGGGLPFPVAYPFYNKRKNTLITTTVPTTHTPRRDNPNPLPPIPNFDSAAAFFTTGRGGAGRGHGHGTGGEETAVRRGGSAGQIGDTGEEQHPRFGFAGQGTGELTAHPPLFSVLERWPSPRTTPPTTRPAYVAVGFCRTRKGRSADPDLLCPSAEGAQERYQEAQVQPIPLP